MVSIAGVVPAKLLLVFGMKFTLAFSLQQPLFPRLPQASCSPTMIKQNPKFHFNIV